MGCKAVDNSDERAASPSLSDDLLFATICIIGVPVEVQVKDGSIYSGIFHTACVEKEYGVVLKRARMTKKGKNDSNLQIGAIVDTLVILSGDLVQVVAKGVILQTDGAVGSAAEDDIGAVTGYASPVECVESESCNKVDLKRLAVDATQKSEIRFSDENENKYANDFISVSSGDDLFGKAEEMLDVNEEAFPLERILNIDNGKVDGMHREKNEEASTFSDYVGQIGKEESHGKKEQYYRQHEVHEEDAIIEVQRSSSNMDAFLTKLKSIDGKNLGMSLNNFSNGDPSFVKPDTQDCQRPASTDFFLDVSTSSTSGVDVPRQSCSTSFTSSTNTVHPRSSAFNTNSKEFRLNPGAKTFSPSFAIPRATTPPVPTVASMAYIPNNSPLVPVAGVQPEIGVSPFAPRSSLPVKFVQYSNSVVGNGGSGSQYTLPIVGHVGSRQQPVRYASQYPIQAGPAYVHPNSQPVMVGRLGQLLYVHPVSHDAVQGAAAVSQVPTRSLLTSHQAHYPKHQVIGNGTAPAVHLCVAPPTFVAGGQHPLAIPTPIQLAQSVFPTIQPITVPGANGLFGSKFQ